jgi:hypothetical protein
MGRRRRWSGSNTSKGRLGKELIAAGLLMLAGPVYLDDLDNWIHVGWERRPGPTSEFGFD